jgi:hypothetical protein
MFHPSVPLSRWLTLYWLQERRRARRQLILWSAAAAPLLYLLTYWR